jgi:putative component of membrane protein insertase Oxa1/YidC/SpoIIIJ protein YidD
MRPQDILRSTSALTPSITMRDSAFRLWGTLGVWAATQDHPLSALSDVRLVRNCGVSFMSCHVMSYIWNQVVLGSGPVCWYVIYMQSFLLAQCRGRPTCWMMCDYCNKMFVMEMVRTWKWMISRLKVDRLYHSSHSSQSSKLGIQIACCLGTSTNIWSEGIQHVSF